MSQISLEEVPTYEEAVANVRQIRNVPQQAPPARSTVKHSYRVRDLSLEFESYAYAPEAFPILFTNSAVTGRLIWNLAKEEAPLSVTVSVRLASISMIFLANPDQGICYPGRRMDRTDGFHLSVIHNPRQRIGSRQALLEAVEGFRGASHSPIGSYPRQPWGACL